MDLWGGQLVEKKSVRREISRRIQQQSALDRKELSFISRALLDRDDGENVLLWSGSQRIDGNWVIDRHQTWVKRNDIAGVVCLGDLTIDGDLINAAWDYWPLLFVAGDLRAANIVKGGMPLLVLGDLWIEGFFTTEYNDGLLRVGGSLEAAGYIPRCKDQPEARGHVIAGEVRAPVFDARSPEVGRREVREAFVPEVISEGWWDSTAIVERWRAGLPVWRDPSMGPAQHPPPFEPLPLPAIEGIDPTPLGVLEDAAAAEAGLVARIQATDFPGELDYRDDFAEYVRPWLSEVGGQVLRLPAGTRLAGDLQLDYEIDWIDQEERIAAVVCDGDLTIEGDVLNRTLDFGPMLFVAGDLRVRNVIKGGSTFIVLGSLHAEGIVVAEYNHGILRIGHDLSAEAYIILDQSTAVVGEIRAPRIDDREDDLRERIVHEVFAREEDAAPDVDQLWARSRAGLPVVR